MDVFAPKVNASMSNDRTILHLQKSPSKFYAVLISVNYFMMDGFMDTTGWLLAFKVLLHIQRLIKNENLGSEIWCIICCTIEMSSLTAMVRIWRCPTRKHDYASYLFCVHDQAQLLNATIYRYVFFCACACQSVPRDWSNEPSSSSLLSGFRLHHFCEPVHILCHFYCSTLRCMP
jgi:hypothetical protein